MEKIKEDQAIKEAKAEIKKIKVPKAPKQEHGLTKALKTFFGK